MIQFKNIESELKEGKLLRVAWNDSVINRSVPAFYAQIFPNPDGDLDYGNMPLPVKRNTMEYSGPGTISTISFADGYVTRGVSGIHKSGIQSHPSHLDLVVMDGMDLYAFHQNNCYVALLPGNEEVRASRLYPAIHKLEQDLMGIE